jgi:hypothetical protein
MLLGLIAMTTAGAAIPDSIALPRYRISDAFVYTDGRVERVKAIRGNRITWAGLNNVGYTRSRNFYTPILSWRFGKGTGRREIVGEANALWPLAKPKTVRFRAIAYTKPKPTSGVRRAMTLWTCSSKKPLTIETPLGAFATIPIVCDRYSATSMRLIERIEWNYSPDLRHYVRRSSVDYYHGTRSTILLTAALSGPAANTRRLTALSRKARVEYGNKNPKPR